MNNKTDCGFDVGKVAEAVIGDMFGAPIFAPTTELTDGKAYNLVYDADNSCFNLTENTV